MIPGAAAPRTGVGVGAAAAPEGRTWHPTAPTCSAHGGSRAAPRPAVRAQRRCRARNIVQGAASGRAQCRCTNNQGQRGAAAAPEGRIWPTTAPALTCPRRLSCCSTPRCSSPATLPCAEQCQGSCSRPRPVPLHQEPGSERSSRRTRGAHLASDGPNPRLPTGAPVLLHAPLLVPSGASVRGKGPGNCLR